MKNAPIVDRSRFAALTLTGEIAESIYGRGTGPRVNRKFSLVTVMCVCVCVCL